MVLQTVLVIRVVVHHEYHAMVLAARQVRALLLCRALSVMVRPCSLGHPLNGTADSVCLALPVVVSASLLGLPL